MATKHEIEAILKNEKDLNNLVECAFQAIDTDGSGSLDIDELHVIMM
jgi:Ca2+-binding EF-hand superfamily protein